MRMPTTEDCKKFAKRWTWRGCGAALWFLFLRGTFGLFQEVPHCAWVEPFFSVDYAVYRFVSYLGFFILSSLINRTFGGGFWDLLGFYAYLTFFPLIAIFILFFEVMSLSITTFDQVIAIFKGFGSNYFLAISALLWPITAYWLVKFSGRPALLLMTLFALFALRLLIELAIQATVPLRVVDTCMKWFVEKFYEIEIKPEEKADVVIKLDDKQFSSKIESIAKEKNQRQEMEKFFKAYADEHGKPYLLVGAFLLIFASAYFVAMSTFALEIFALNRHDANAFYGQFIRGTFDCFYMSLMWISTSSPEGFVPQSTAAKALVAAETVTGVSLFTLLILCFSSVLSHHVAEGLEVINSVLAHIDKGISARAEVLNDSQVELRMTTIASEKK